MLQPTYDDKITPQQIVSLSVHKPFVDWVTKVSAMGAKAIYVRDVVFFGPRPGFVFAEASLTGPEGQRIPGLSFIRGDSVGILVVLKPALCTEFVESAKKTLLVGQNRVPIGDKDFAEIPAGMIDDDGHFSGQAAKEIREETGLIITEDRLIPLGTFYPSPGGCDEKIALFATEISLPAAEIETLQGKLTGLRDEGEIIKLDICDLDQMPQRSGNQHGQDMKSTLAALLYKTRTPAI